MTVNDIINALSNRDDFNYIILEGEQAYAHHFNNHSDITTEWLDADIKSFTIGWENIYFYV